MFPLNIAVRFLNSNKMQTILIVFGIAVGVSVQIFIGLLIQGLQASLIDRTIGNQSQVTIYGKDDELIDNWENKIEKLEALSGDITNIAPIVQSAAFIQNDNKNTSILLKGVDFNRSNNIYKIDDNLVEGSMPEAANEILIGVNLSEDFKLKVGSSIDITVPDKEKDSFTISGIFDFKVAQLNEQWVIGDLNYIQNYFGFGNKVSLIEIQVDKVFEADLVQEKVKKELIDNNIIVENWIEQNEQLLSGLKGQDISSLMIQIFVLIAVMLGISSVLAITVMQKSKQLGILKAMGIKDRTASSIFLFEGLFLGLIGAFLGVALGVGLLLSFQTFAVNPDGTPVVEILFNMNFIILSGVIAVIVSTVASLIPAKRSSKLNPIEVIRNG